MEMTDKEIKAVEKATIYDLRRIFTRVNKVRVNRKGGLATAPTVKNSITDN